MRKLGIKRWPKTKFEKDLEKLIKQESRRAVKWLFFYQFENNMDAILHVFDVIALLFIAWRLMSM
jgi:hypothetical protein